VHSLAAWISKRKAGNHCSRAQWGCPPFSVPKHATQPAIQIPSTLVQLYSAIPLHYVVVTKRLLAGLVVARDYGQLYAIDQVPDVRHNLAS
jgi:hypothetical protein